jgi:hypothetical protein
MTRSVKSGSNPSLCTFCPGSLLGSLLILAGSLGTSSVSRGQGRIDPSLPTAPLNYTRILVLFPGAKTVKDPQAVVAPLTKKQKYSIFLRRTVDISLPVEALVFAGASQWLNYSPEYGQGWNAFAQRFGSYTGSIVSSSFFTDAFLPSLMHQDPRYFRKGRGSVRSRLLYAFESAFVTHTDTGKATFNSSSVLGLGMSTALTNSWYPSQNLTLGNTMERYAIKVGISAAVNVIREFGAGR